jgi:hypothetical protein
MMRRVGLVIGMVAALLGGAADVRAQAAWDSPMLLPPQPVDGFGIFLMDAAGGGLGVMALYRSPVWNYGLRGGIAESPRDNISVFAGVDYSGYITRASPDFPLDVDWVFGAGASVDGNVRISIPLGLTTGHTFRGEGATFTPYATPRVVFDALLGDRDPPPTRRTRLDVVVDLGLDLDITRAFLIRFGATIGRRDAVALGLFF